MGVLTGIHKEIVAGLEKHFPLDRVKLNYPLPVRPRRMLGLVKMDGEVYSTEKLMRTVCFRIKFPVFLNIYTTFIRSRIEYDLPALICEVVFVGKKIILVLDVHRTGDVAELEQDKPLFDKLTEIKGRYKDLLAFEMAAKGGLKEIVASRAMCRLKIGAAQEQRAAELIKEYIDAFGEAVVLSPKLSGEALVSAQEDFNSYLETVVEHDPGVKGNKIFFGKEEGVKRALEMFYGI